MSRRYSYTGIVLGALLSVSAAYAQETVNWTLGDVDSASHWGPVAGEQLAKAVDEATDGQLKITVYPTESLFKGKDSLDAVSNDLTQMYRVSGAHVGGEERILELMDLPLFVPADYEFRAKLWDALTPMYRDLLMERYNVYLAGILQAEPRMIYTKEPIENLADLSGRKIRSSGPVETEFTGAIGMVPVGVAPSEIYTGLQQGLLDGNWVADAPHFYNKGFEVTKYIYDVGSAGAGFFVLVNGEALEALPAESRDALMTALPDYVAALREGSRGGFANGRDWLIKEGMTVVPVSPEDRATMQAAAAKIVEAWQERLDPESHAIYVKAKEMIDEYNAAKG
ncbi:MAG TPA: TRAP transporter substrate-binding protein DctP [Geminicoccaceae bacterium]|nr:TRAP transporter substrate-binding protein DctP [Geminicoccaceae bacterium]